MILTPIDSGRLPAALARFAQGLDDASARAVFARLARPAEAARAAGHAAAMHHRQALDLAAAFGIAVAPGAPQESYSWDGRILRGGTEAYVLVHEIAHFQLAAPTRRHCIDFGLGPGPETGDRAGAEAAQCLFGLAREREEAMASLLGILWELELGHPALASFLDQNWLEGVGRPGTAAHFERILTGLCAAGFITAEGRPRRHLRQVPDAAESTAAAR